MSVCCVCVHLSVLHMVPSYFFVFLCDLELYINSNFRIICLVTMEISIRNVSDQDKPYHEDLGGISQQQLHRTQ